MVSQLLALLFIPVFFTAVLFKSKFTSDITPEVTNFPKKKLAVVGLLDTMSSMIVLIAGVKVSGPMTAMLSQAVIPACMVASRLVIGTRYHLVHYVGSLVIILGVFVVMIPNFFGKDGEGTGSIGYGFIFMTNVIPTALSGIYKEISLKSINMDIYYLNAWVAFFQFFIGLPFLPLAMLWLKIPIKDSWSNLVEGFQCGFMGSSGSRLASVLAETGATVDPCIQARTVLLIYFALVIIFNIYFLQVMKLGSTVIMYGGSTISVPLASLLFSVRKLVGKSYHRFHLTDFVGLAVLVAGLVVYRLKPEGVEEDPEGKDPLSMTALLADNVDGAGAPGTPLVASNVRYLPPADQLSINDGY